MQLMVECKLDGISLRATYQDGKLVELVTRGDGLVGDDITAHAPHICNLPQTIQVMGRVDVRGEGVMYEKDFHTLFATRKDAKGVQRYKNARNTVSGLLKGRTPPEDLKYVHFVAYKYYHSDTDFQYEEEITTQLGTVGFEIPGIAQVTNSLAETVALYDAYDAPNGFREKLPYKTDGLVLTVNRIVDQEKLPEVGNRPGSAIAIKPTPKAAVSKIIGISWEMGLSGAYTPVALVEPCELDGTTCKKINMFNLDFLDIWVNGGYLKSQDKTVDGGFGIGATVLIIRTGDVLPYLSNVLAPAPKEVAIAG